MPPSHPPQSHNQTTNNALGCSPPRLRPSDCPTNTSEKNNPFFPSLMHPISHSIQKIDSLLQPIEGIIMEKNGEMLKLAPLGHCSKHCRSPLDGRSEGVVGGVNGKTIRRKRVIQHFKTTTPAGLSDIQRMCCSLSLSLSLPLQTIFIVHSHLQSLNRINSTFFSPSPPFSLNNERNLHFWMGAQIKINKSQWAR